MLFSKVLISTLLVLSIYVTLSLVRGSKGFKETSDKLEPDYEKHEKFQENENEANIEGGVVSKSVHEADTIYFEKHEHVSRLARSDNITMVLNSTGIEKPDAQLMPNNTGPSKAIDQMHTFLSDKAREGAYQKTEAQEHPYSVSYLLYNRKGDELGACSGTLVRNSWVVTAAHCIVDKPLHRVKVYGGVTFNVFRPPRNLPKTSQVRTSYAFFANPRFDPNSDDVDYDIALIRIDPPFISTNFLSPIPMTTTPWSYNGSRKCILTVFGAVRDERRSPDDYIRKTQCLLVKKPCDCISYFDKHVGTPAVTRYICMKPMQDFGICSGDSGGGLICDGELKATVSYSLSIVDLHQCHLKGPSGSGECGDVDLFSVFHDLYPSLSWIRENAFDINATKARRSRRRRRRRRRKWKNKKNSTRRNEASGRRQSLGTVLWIVLFGLECTNTRY